MTKQEIVSKLIATYETAIFSIDPGDSLDSAKSCCYAFGVQQGVCTAMARMATSSEEMRDNWLLLADTFVKYNDFGSPFWGETPNYAKTTTELLNYLTYRLNNLYDIFASFAIQQTQCN